MMEVMEHCLVQTVRSTPSLIALKSVIITKYACDIFFDYSAKDRFCQPLFCFEH